MGALEAGDHPVRNINHNGPINGMVLEEEFYLLTGTTEGVEVHVLFFLLDIVYVAKRSGLRMYTTVEFERLS